MAEEIYTIEELLLKHLQGELTAGEEAVLQQWINSSDKNKVLFKELTDPAILEKKLQTFHQIESLKEEMRKRLMSGAEKTGKLRWLSRRTAVAASILLIISIGVLYFIIPKRSGEPAVIAKQNDVTAPTQTKATLTLADGRTIYLDSLEAGTIATQNQVTVTKDAAGNIVYSDVLLKANGQQLTAISYNTLSNPRGSKVIDLNLSDGSHVWLNAGSSITYPIAFVSNDRKVTITGEAYFEITHDKSKPFIVSANNKADVTVLGTHFNVNAYDDESEIKTTLLEGSVRVSVAHSAVNLAPFAIQIKPGQQAVLSLSKDANGQKLTANSSPDLDEVMAWKNGKFYFNQADIQTIMRQVARWYDVDIVYENGVIPTGHYNGKPSRQLSAAEMLKIVEYSGVKISIENKRIIVKQ